ncbi:hypothetical protein EC988_003667, partial [Linderina pennispora]
MADESPTAALAQSMLLESFLDQATRYALRLLTLRMRLGRIQERRHRDDAETLYSDAARYFDELKTLTPQLQSTFGVVEKLRQRGCVTGSTEGFRVRTRVYELIGSCFSDILPISDRRHSEQFGSVRQWPLTAYDPREDDMTAHPMWSLMRPNRPPQTILQIFLDLSQQLVVFHGTHSEALTQVSVGAEWFSILSMLLAQLALASSVFGEYSNDQVVAALDYVGPDADQGRTTLYPELWGAATSQLAADLDQELIGIKKLAKKMRSKRTADAAITELAELKSPHAFANRLVVYLGAVLDRLEPPTLDVYSSIRQSGSFPPGFFSSPDDSLDLPAHPQLIFDPEASPNPFSPEPAPQTMDDLAAITRSLQPQRIYVPDTPTAMHIDGDSMPASPSEDVLMRSARRPTRLAARRSSLESEEEEAPNHAIDPTSPQLAQTPQHASSSMISADTIDIENTVIAESPSALLSAKHDRRLSRTGRALHDQPPPALDFASIQQPPQTPPRKTTVTRSAMTTPKSQTGKAAEKPRYVDNWRQGDVEGGGRPHRKRHNSRPATPTNLRSMPPPPSLLSPKILAAAKRKNIDFDDMVRDSERQTTPEKRPRLEAPLSMLTPSAQVTPEHQTGAATDLGAQSATR